MQYTRSIITYITHTPHQTWTPPLAAEHPDIFGAQIHLIMAARAPRRSLRWLWSLYTVLGSSRCCFDIYNEIFISNQTQCFCSHRGKKTKPRQQAASSLHSSDGDRLTTCCLPFQTALSTGLLLLHWIRKTRKQNKVPLTVCLRGEYKHGKLTLARAGEFLFWF